MPPAANSPQPTNQNNLLAEDTKSPTFGRWGYFLRFTLTEGQGFSITTGKKTWQDSLNLAFKASAYLNTLK